jgi:hypothetical protein
LLGWKHMTSSRRSRHRSGTSVSPFVSSSKVETTVSVLMGSSISPDNSHSHDISLSFLLLHATLFLLDSHRWWVSIFMIVQDPSKWARRWWTLNSEPLSHYFSVTSFTHLENDTMLSREHRVWWAGTVEIPMPGYKGNVTF